MGELFGGIQITEVLQDRLRQLLINSCGSKTFLFPDLMHAYKVLGLRSSSSSETRGQIVEARESLNGRKNMAQRKEKNGENSPSGQCLTRLVPNVRRRSGF